MALKVTTSIRLEPRLRRALERRAAKEKRGKNWIISRALEEYLTREERSDLAAEARRQSLLVSSREIGDWAPDADFGQWK